MPTRKSSKSYSKNKNHDDSAFSQFSEFLHNNGLPKNQDQLKDLLELFFSAIKRSSFYSLRHKRFLVTVLSIFFGVFFLRKISHRNRAATRVYVDDEGNALRPEDLADVNFQDLEKQITSSASFSDGDGNGDENTAELEDQDFTSRTRIVPMVSKSGGSTHVVITTDANYEIKPNHKLLLFLSSKDLTSEEWTNSKNIARRFTKIGYYPIFVDLPGYGKATRFSKPNEVSESRGWNMFVHTFFKTVNKIYDNRDIYLVGMQEAGEFITPFIIESGLSPHLNGMSTGMVVHNTSSTNPLVASHNNVHDAHNQMLETVKLILTSQDVTEFNMLVPTKIAKFRIPHFWIYYSSKSQDLASMHTELLVKSMRKMKYLHEAYYQICYEGTPAQHLDTFYNGLVNWMDKLLNSSPPENNPTEYGWHKLPHETPVLHPKDIKEKQHEIRLYRSERKLRFMEAHPEIFGDMQHPVSREEEQKRLKAFAKEHHLGQFSEDAKGHIDVGDVAGKAGGVGIAAGKGKAIRGSDAILRLKVGKGKMSKAAKLKMMAKKKRSLVQSIG